MPFPIEHFDGNEFCPSNSAKPALRFVGKRTNSRRLFAWACERRRRTSELQLGSPPVATRNGLAQPTRIGAPGTPRQLAGRFPFPPIGPLRKGKREMHGS